MPTAAEDKDAIRELMAEYCFHLDDGRYDDMAALFTEDGAWDTAFGKATGRAAIAALAAAEDSEAVGARSSDAAVAGGTGEGTGAEAAAVRADKTATGVATGASRRAAAPGASEFVCEAGAFCGRLESGAATAAFFSGSAVGVVCRTFAVAPNTAEKSAGRCESAD